MKDSIAQASPALVGRAALISSLIAGTTIVLFTIAGQHAPVTALFEGIARIVFRGQPLAPAYAAGIGALLHYGVSFGWALGYAVLARNTSALLRAPLISGLCFGIVVELTMVGLLVMINAFPPQTPTQFLRDLLAHTLGFGVPLAATIARMLSIKQYANRNTH